MTTKRLYWDSCVFIDRIARTAGRIDALEQITDAATGGDIIIVASTLCIAECYKIKESLDSWSVQKKLINDFFDNPWIELVQVDSVVAEKAQEISRDFGIKPPDAIHIATAILRKAEEFQTYDGKKGHSPLKFDGLIGKPPLRIKVPQLIDRQQALEFKDDEQDEDEEVTEGTSGPTGILAISGPDAETPIGPQDGDGQARPGVQEGQIAAKSGAQEGDLGDQLPPDDHDV